MIELCGKIFVLSINELVRKCPAITLPFTTSLGQQPVHFRANADRPHWLCPKAEFSSPYRRDYGYHNWNPPAYHNCTHLGGLWNVTRDSSCCFGRVTYFRSTRKLLTGPRVTKCDTNLIRLFSVGLPMSGIYQKANLFAEDPNLVCHRLFFKRLRVGWASPFNGLAGGQGWLGKSSQTAKISCVAVRQGQVPSPGQGLQ